MTFPTIPTGSRILVNVQANTTATRTFPDLSGLTKNAGDLLLAICIVYNGTSTDANFSGWTGSFTETDDEGVSGAVSFGVAHKWSTGSETGTFAVTQAGTITGHAAMIVMSIPGAHASAVPEVSAHAATGNPPALTPSWGADDTLWIVAGGCGESSTTGTFDGISAAPTNYTDYKDTGISADVVGGIEGAVAFRHLNATSDDPGAWTSDTSNARNGAITIAIRPNPSVSGTALGSFGGSFTASGVPRTPGAAVGSFGFTGTVSGLRRTAGAASKSFGGTFTAQGAPRKQGQAATSLGGTFTVVGAPRLKGVAVAVFGGTFEAQGVVTPGTPPVTVEGQASASFGGTFTASGASRRVGQALASFGFSATVAGRLVVYHFSPPTYEVQIGSKASKPLPYYRLTTASSVVKVGGVFVSVRTPSAEQLVGLTHGVDYFRGGYEYDISPAIAAQLVSAGYEVTSE